MTQPNNAAARPDCPGGGQQPVADAVNFDLRIAVIAATFVWGAIILAAILAMG